MKLVKSGDFIEFGNSGLRRYHRQEAGEDNFVGTREVLAVASQEGVDWCSVVYADGSGLCSSSYVSLKSGVSFLPKDEVVDRSLSVADVPHYKWGDTATTASHLLDVVTGKVNVGDNTVGGWLRGLNDNLLNRMDVESLYTASRIYHPIWSGDGLITLFLNQKDFDRNRTTQMKVGRAFRHMFQNMNDAQVARITDKWVEETAPRKFVLKKGRTIDDFTSAYLDTRTKSRNLTATRPDYKSLAMSCMHGQTIAGLHEGVDAQFSPAAVYASGDFEIAYLVEEDENGNTLRVAGRVIYSIGKKDEDGGVEIESVNAPIYAACEQSGRMLQDHLEKIGSVSSSTLEEWAGLRMLKIAARHFDTWVAPYLDGDLGCEIHCKYLVLDRDGSYPLNSTEGTLVDGSFCTLCDCSVPDDLVYYTDDGPMCEDCYSENYGECSVSGEICDTSVLVYARYENRWSDTTTVHIDYARYCECVEEWWVEDDVTITPDGEYVPTSRVKDFPDLFGEEVEVELEAVV